METHICENCGKEHDGSYGSGRFCCKHCRMVYVGKIAHKTQIKNGTFKSGFAEHNKKKQHREWPCKICGMIFDTRKQMYEHGHKEHPDNFGHAWNKGQTAKTNKSVQQARETLHKRYESGELLNVWQNKKLPDEMKKSISESMKKAHAEGRANTYALSRNKCGHKISYPEKWFMGVIESEFKNKNYEHEFPFIRYSFDFAWVDLKKEIEIDGWQHYDPRFPENQEHDKIRDEFAKSQGWQVLRIPWHLAFKNPKEWIEKAKQFIDGSV